MQLDATDTNRFSVPYDFCATLLDMMITVRSPYARRFGVRTYWSRYGLDTLDTFISRTDDDEVCHLPNEGMQTRSFIRGAHVLREHLVGI